MNYLYARIAIPHEEWATYAMRAGVCWRQVTNNMAERGMSTMLDVRSFNPTSIVKNYLSRLATTFMKRYENDMSRRQKNHVLTAFAELHFVHIHQHYQNYYVNKTAPNVYQVHKNKILHESSNVEEDCCKVFINNCYSRYYYHKS